MRVTVIDPVPKATLTKATCLLFHVAARSHILAEQFGVEIISPDDDLEKEPSLTFLNVPRPWLETRWIGLNSELSFDPDKYSKTLHQCSTYTHHMRLFILNVWNPSYAKSKGWHFDLFQALGGLDDNNRRAVAWFVQHPIWP